MSHFYYTMYFLFFFSLTFFFFLVSFSLSPKHAITPLLIYNTLTNFFLASLSNAYSLLPQHYQQTIKQSNALYIITSHLISHFLNSNTPTQQLQPKKKLQEFEKEIGSQVPNTITYSNSIHNHP